MRRMKRRLFRHHLMLAIVSAFLMLVVYSLTPGPHLQFRLSMATAYAGLSLVGATLLTGPITILRKRPHPVSSDLRRDIGIWGGIISLGHVVVGLQVHMGSMLLYFLRERGADKRLGLRTDLFGLANYTGLIATLIIALLLALSNDVSLRRLGSKTWKSLQRWNYLGFGLVVLHGILYQVIEKREAPYPLIFGAMVVVVIMIQLAGFWQRRWSGDKPVLKRLDDIGVS